MKLFLASAGIQPETKDDLLKLLGRDPRGMKVAFIPTAVNHPVEKAKNEIKNHVQRSKDKLTELGFVLDEVDIEFYPKEGLRAKLEEADIIYVNGGNTFYLLDQVRKSGLDVYIRELLETRIYMSSSAGSVLVTPNTYPSRWKGMNDTNDSNIEDFAGLSLVPFCLFVHYEEENLRASVEKQAKDFPYKVVCLTNQQAVAVDGDSWEIVGTGEKLIFN